MARSTTARKCRLRSDDGLPLEVVSQCRALAHCKDTSLWPRVRCRRCHVAHRKDIVRAAIAAQELVDADETLPVCFTASAQAAGLCCTGVRLTGCHANSSLCSKA